MQAAWHCSDVATLEEMDTCRSMLINWCRATGLALQAQRQRDLYQNLLTKLNKRLGDTLEAMSAERRSLMDTAEVLRRQFEAVADAAYEGADDELGRSGAVSYQGTVCFKLQAGCLSATGCWLVLHAG